MSDLLANLNPPQLQAVTLPPVHALILAGAGSGKTRVLTTRIAWLVSTNQAGPHGILAVTFTNKAAKEMTARLSALVPINTRGMWIGTFHGLCNRLLRAHHREAGLPQTFQILDSADQLAAVKRLLKNLNVDDEKFPPRELCQFINAHKAINNQKFVYIGGFAIGAHIKEEKLVAPLRDVDVVYRTAFYLINNMSVSNMVFINVSHCFF